ncbi:MAG: translocation/assembly module TamB domain-containing protein, partial [Flavobacterium sp.]
LNFDNFNLGVLSSFGGEILTDIRGLASGRSNLSGELTNLDINGRLFVNKAGVRIPYLNVDYTIADDVVLDVTENNFYVSNAQLFDKKHNTSGTLNGTIAHKNFSDWKFDLAINSKRLLALDTNYSEDAAYYGTAFMDGSASIKGPLDALKINVVAKSEKGTQVKIPISDAESTDINNALHFITKNEKYKINNGAQTVRNYNGIDLEFEFDITPDAEVEIVLDRNTGHGMKGKGFGSLLIKINTLGKFNMWGDFQAYEGVYNFRYGGLINKKFKVKKGGSISWEGDPMRANLNLEAVYSTTANPGELIENASFNKKVPTDVVIGLKGNLSNPDPNFEINFPTVSPVLQSEIQTKLDDKDIRQKQALILLSTGGFLSVDGLNQSSIKNNLYEKVGDLFGSVFNDNDGKFVVGVDIVSADTNPAANTDGRLGVNFTTKLNERISINGKVGVPIGGVNESTIVGDVEIQYRVNEDGTLNLKVFNKENNVNYFVGEGVGYTQGIGISYEVDFETFKQLLQKIFVNQKVEKLSSSSTQKEVQDSDILPDFIHLNNQEKKEPENKTPNREGLPPEE